MEWKEAHARIEESITVGTYLGIKEFQGVFITALSYDGFVVRIGEDPTFNIKWFILEHCWKSMNERRIFNLHIFKEIFGDDCLSNPAFADVVGRIFLRADLAKCYENTYHNYKDRLYRQIKLRLVDRFSEYA